MAFPKDPSPIFFNLSYLSMSVEKTSHSEAEGTKHMKIKLAEKQYKDF